MFKFTKQKKGFTLVELMVAIAVFSIVMVVAMGALLNVIDANLKAQAIKTAINNVNFALESISKDMRVGTDYACGSSNNISDIDESSPNCLGGGKIIRYRSFRADIDPVATSSHRFAYYRYNDQDLSIETCLEKAPVIISNCTDNSVDWSRITSPEVRITSMKFWVISSSDNPLDKYQPRMVITLSGEAGSKDKIKTTFDLQTGVSQRVR